jgi:hypothetical protein
MTEKANAVMQKLRLKKLFFSPGTRERVLEDFNRSTLDDAQPVGSPDQHSTALDDMNNFQAEAEDIYRNAGAGLKTI